MGTYKFIPEHNDEDKESYPAAVVVKALGDRKIELSIYCNFNKRWVNRSATSEKLEFSGYKDKWWIISGEIDKKGKCAGKVTFRSGIDLELAEGTSIQVITDCCNSSLDFEWKSSNLDIDKVREIK